MERSWRGKFRPLIWRGALAVAAMLGLATGAAAQSASIVPQAAPGHTNGTVTTQITIDNSTGGSDITGVQYRATFAPFLGNIRAFACTGGTACGTLEPDPALPDDLRMQLGTIAAGTVQTLTLSYEATVAAGTYTVQHLLTGGGISAAASNTVAVPKATVSIGPSTLAGGVVSTQFTISTAAPTPDSMPMWYKIGNLPPSGVMAGTCTTTSGNPCYGPSLNGSELSVAVSALPAGGSDTVTVTYLIDGTVGTHTATHSTDSQWVVPLSQNNTVTVAPPPPAPATVSHGNAAPASGSTMTTLPAAVQLDVHIDNSAPGATAIAAGSAAYTIRLLVPPWSGLLSQGSFSCTGPDAALCGSVTTTSNAMNMPLGAIAAGQNVSFTLNYTLPALLLNGSYLAHHEVVGGGAVAANGRGYAFDVALTGTSISHSYHHFATVTAPGTVSTSVIVYHFGGAAPGADAASYTISGLPPGASNATCVVGGTATPCSTGNPASISGNTLTASLPAMAAGAMSGFTVTYDLPATVPAATYNLLHNVSGAGITTTSPPQASTLAVLAASALPAAGQASLDVARGSNFVEATVVINNLGTYSSIPGGVYTVTDLPAGIAAIACAPSALCGTASHDAGTNTHTVPLGPIPNDTLATITFRYPVSAATPDHTGTHRISGGGMNPQTRMLPFAWSSGGAVSVPAVALPGLLLLSLLAAGVPAAVARRRRR